MKALLIPAFAVMLGACASDPAQEAAASDGTVCTRETPIGSNFRETKCRTAAQVAQDKADAERVKEGIRQSTTMRPATQ
ncbi:MAG: hypothetical protein IAE86_02470 [Burkholderiaceae bacterium]|nr:hypothetical protein [Burkholderiaceae bacterium]